MAENDDQQNGGKKNWSLAESVLSSNTPGVPARVPGAGTNDANIVPATQSNLSPPTIIPRPDLVASQGILAKLKSNKMGRKAALEQLQEQYSGQLEILKETITQAVKVHKTKVGVAAEEYLKILDSEHLEVLTQLGMRNASTRWKAVTDLTDMAVAKVNEVEGKNWPESLVRDTIAKIFELRERVANEIMKELGIEHAKD